MLKVNTMNRTSLSLLCGLVLVGAQALGQETNKSPEPKDALKAVYIVGVTGMT